MAEKVHFLPIDLQVHRSQVFDIMVEYSEWTTKEIWEHFKIDILAARGISSIREYVASDFDRLISEVSSRGVFYLVESEGVMIGMGALDQNGEKTGAIKRMYIRSAYRGKGYGRAYCNSYCKKRRNSDTIQSIWILDDS